MYPIGFYIEKRPLWVTYQNSILVPIYLVSGYLVTRLVSILYWLLTPKVEVMKTNEAMEPQFEYVVVEDEFNIINEVFDELFECIEKEIRQRI